MLEKRNKITSKQLMTYIVSSQIGIGVLSMPARLCEIVGHDGWITVLITGVISTILGAIMVKLLERYENKSVYEINKSLYGKYIGTFINILLALLLCALASFNIRVFVTTISIIVLPKTPPVILTVFLLLPGLLLAWYGLKVICRFNSYVFFATVIIYLFYILMLKNVRITFLMPVGEANIPSLIKSTLVLTLSYIGLIFPAIFYPQVTDKKNVMKNIIYANIFSTIFFLITISIVTGFFGSSMLKYLVFPLLNLARSYRAPVIERVDLLFITLWTPCLGISMSTFYFSAYYSVNILLKIKKNTLPLIILTIVFIILSRIIKDFAEIFIYAKILSIISIVFTLFLFIINYFASFINKKGVVKK